jgi:CheY-like chemotaxis protein
MDVQIQPKRDRPRERSAMESSVPGVNDTVAAAAALIVEPVLADAMFLVNAVSELGLHVTVAATFQEAVERLRVSPTLLVADIRLGEYNGLHLVLRGKAARRELAAVVTSAAADPVLRAEAEQLGATFVLKPSTPEEIRAALCRTLFRPIGSAEPPIRPPFERRKVERRMTPRPYLHPDRRQNERRRSVLAIHRGTPA